MTFLVEGFREGFTLGYEGPSGHKDESDNIPFSPGVGDKFELWDKIMKEVKLKRFLGPWAKGNIPFDEYIQSPVGLIPKAEGQTQLIFHLSYNFKNGNQSINHWTPNEICTIKYRDLDHAIKNCVGFIRMRKSGADKKGGNSVVFDYLFFGKTDLKNAFCWLPMSKRFWKFLMLKAENPKTGEWMFFVDKCMPFGASISCVHFQRLSNALKHIVESLEQVYNIITNYLDDFLFIHYLRQVCNRIMRRFLLVCEMINFPVAEDKTEWASTIVTFLGLMLNGWTFTLMVPDEKKWKVINILSKFYNAKKVTIKDIQILTGVLNFLNKAIVPGRVFTRRFYNKLQTKMTNGSGKQLKQFHHVNIDKEMKNDCETWLTFLTNQKAVNRPFVDFDLEITGEDVGFFTDSSRNPDLGFGCYFAKKKE